MSGRRLVSKSEFARMAGVSPSVITKSTAKAGGMLAGALVGKKYIDVDSPAAVEYLRRRNVTDPGDGPDPLFDRAIAECYQFDRWTVRHLRDRLGIGAERARRLLTAIHAAGVVPAEHADPAFVPSAPAVSASAPAPVATAPAPAPVATAPAPAPGERKPSGWTARNAKRAAEAAHVDPINIPDDIRAFLDWTLRDILDKFGTDLAFNEWLKASKMIEDINEKRLKNAATRGELVSRDLVAVGVFDPINAAHSKMLTDGARTIAVRAHAMAGSGRTVEDIEKLVYDQLSAFIRPMKAQIVRALKSVEP